LLRHRPETLDFYDGTQNGESNLSEFVSDSKYIDNIFNSCAFKQLPQREIDACLSRVVWYGDNISEKADMSLIDIEFGDISVLSKKPKVFTFGSEKYQKQITPMTIQYNSVAESEKNTTEILGSDSKSKKGPIPSLLFTAQEKKILRKVLLLYFKLNELVSMNMNTTD
jgi:hypothetical protein